MPKEPIRRYKIIKPFYCYHPEIVFDGRRRNAFWGVEWTIWIKNNPQPRIAVHFMRQVETEEQARGLVDELREIGTEFTPWQVLDGRAWYLQPKYRMAPINLKKRVIAPCSKNHSE